MKKRILYILIFCSLLPFCAMGQNYTENADLATEFTAEKGQKIQISFAESTLFIIGAQENAKIEIKNMLGENVYTSHVKTDKEKIYMNLKSGFYIVKIENTVQRIIIK